MGLAHEVEAGLNDPLDRMSLALPNAGRYDDRKRESRLDSADQAEDIFDLYERDRDSWNKQDGTAGRRLVEDEAGRRRSSVNGRGSLAPMAEDLEDGSNGDGEITKQVNSGPPGSPGSWTGPLTALAEPQVDRPTSQASEQPIQQTVTSPLSASRRSSSQPQTQHPTSPPEILVTPDKTKRANDGSHVNGGSWRHQRDSTLSLSSSASTSLAPTATPSPSHPGSNRLLARAAGLGSAGASQVSFGGSIQYPGEENDAFHVRSTYARLEAEGVHGDGWDPGVERTRGGPSQGKRATMFEANKTATVGESEKEFLASLDRYGFVNEPLRNRSETRLASIPSAPLLKIPKLPNRSSVPPSSSHPPPTPHFGPPDGDPPKMPDPPKPVRGAAEAQRKKEESRVGKWMKMMSVKRRDQGGNTVEWGWRSDMKRKVDKRVYKGVPDRWRMAAWWTLAEQKVGEYRNTRKGKERETRSVDELLQEYRHAIDLPSTHDVQIDLDVPRTISGHTLFVTRYGSGQRSLFHVLHSFSLVCETCGYCQGMGSIAATLLCYFEPERVYALLVRLHDVYEMHTIFAPGFPGLLEAFYVQERLMEYLMPEVYMSFQRNMISSSAWGTKWYITLFVNTIPFSQQLRLWDALWLDGRDVMIMTSIAILWAFRDALSASNATFESILSLLSSYFVAEDEDTLMRFVRKMLAQPGVRARMDGWRDEWAKLVAEGKSQSALL